MELTSKIETLKTMDREKTTPGLTGEKTIETSEMKG